MPTSALPFDVEVFTKAYVPKGHLGAVLSLSGQVAFNSAGSLEFTIPESHPRRADLSADGARVTLHYRPTPDLRVFMLSGRVDEVGGGGSPKAPWRRFRVIDDWTVLSDEVQCWPNPTGTISQQGDDEAYFTRSGPAETVVKQTLTPNVARQGTVLSIPATASRGSSITLKTRFHVFAERAFPLVEQAGLGVRVRQQDATRVLDVFEPHTYPRVLTQDSGVVSSGEYSVSAPTVTRVVALGPGEGTARVTRQKIATALETAHGVRLPLVVDARDVDAADPNLDAILTERMDEALAEGAPRASITCELVETATFRFGVAFDVGDRVTIRLTKAPPVTDIVRTVDFTWEPGSRPKVTPKVGDWADTSDAAMVKQVKSITRSLSNLQKG